MEDFPLGDSRPALVPGRWHLDYPERDLVLAGVAGDDLAAANQQVSLRCPRSSIAFS
jgi:hypothetical protein